MHHWPMHSECIWYHSPVVQQLSSAGAPGRQGGMCGEMRLFLDTWAKHQTQQKIGFGALKVRSLKI